MTRRQNRRIWAGLILAAGLTASSFTAALVSGLYGRSQYQVIGSVCGEILEAEPEMEQTLLAALKRYKSQPSTQEEGNVLPSFGYRPVDFIKPGHRAVMLFAAAGSVAGGCLLLLAFWERRKRAAARIEELALYLERVNTGDPGLLLNSGEDDLSRLQDEIYKTVTMLYQTSEEAVKAKTDFAKNLSNIAHQLKTPVTAISLSTQMMKSNPSPDYPEQIEKQLGRLVHLEEALLLLSRLDAGALPLERVKVDVFTLLTLAADNLQEMVSESDVAVDIPETGAVEITADLDWTMEAVMNLLKNCMEYTPPGGIIRCSYDQNPLYTEIVIRDGGRGFSTEDIPHLFERFYRGKNATKGGIGIGLAIAREIIEMQNGTLHAGNLPDGGGCFEIRFYSH